MGLLLKILKIYKLKKLKSNKKVVAKHKYECAAKNFAS